MSGNREAFQQAMNQGHSAAWDQRWDHAVRFYELALQEFPEDSKALSSLGLAYYELQDYETSLRYYMRAARFSPQDPIPFDKVATLCERLGKLEHSQQAAMQAAELYLRAREIQKAIENWQRVTRLNPGNLRAYERLAVIYEHTGENEAAVDAYLALASLYQHGNELEKAVKAATHALELLPNHIEARQTLTWLRDFKPLPMPERPRGGTGPLRMAQVRQLTSPESEVDAQNDMLDPVAEARKKALTYLAGMLFEIPEEGDENVEALHGLQAIIRGSGRTSSRKIDQGRLMLHLSQVVDLQTQGEFPQATEELERAMEAGLDHPAAYFDLGLLRIESNHYESAIRALQYAVSHPDYALATRLLLGSAYFKTGRMRDSSIEYLQALRLADGAVVSENDEEDLRQLYEPLIEAQRDVTDDDQHLRVCNNIEGLLMRPDWRAQLSQARTQLPSQPGGGPPVPIAEVMLQARSSQAVESLAKISRLAGEGNLRAAMEEAFFALQYAPAYLPLHAYMGELLLMQGNLQDAIGKFLVVAQTYSARGEPRRAIDLYRRVIELAPMDIAPRTHLIHQLLALGRLEAAMEEYLALAEVYYNLADLEKARKTYAEALLIAQQSNLGRDWQVKFLNRMADIDVQSLDWRQALRVYEQIRTLQPDYRPARTNLVELNIRLGQESQALSELDSYLSLLISAGQTDAALEFLEMLVKDKPEKPYIRRRLAQLYQREGRYQDAIAQFDAVGEMLLQSGEIQAAIQVVETILSLKPANVEEYQKLLIQLKQDQP